MPFAKRWRRWVSIGLLFGLCACEWVGCNPRLSQLESVAEAFPDREELGDELGVQLAMQGEPRKEASIHTFEAKGLEGVFSRAELRATTQSNPNQGALLLLSGEGKPCIQRKAVEDFFGKELEEAPAPSNRFHDHSHVPDYIHYQRGEAELRLGFDQESKCLVRMVLDSIRPKGPPPGGEVVAPGQE